MNEPNVEVLLTSKADAQPIRNLYPLYLHEIASYEHKPPNRHGVLSEDDDDHTWEQLLDRQSAWWEKPGVLFPYVILADGVPAGFNWISTGPYVPTPGVDIVQHEFFVTHEWRGKGVAAEAFRLGLGRHNGSWEVCTWPTAPRAIAFWRKTLAEYVAGEVKETMEDHPWGKRVVFRFENPAE